MKMEVSVKFSFIIDFQWTNGALLLTHTKCGTPVLYFGRGGGGGGEGVLLKERDREREGDREREWKEQHVPAPG